MDFKPHYLFSDTTAQKRLAVYFSTFLVLLWTLRRSRWTVTPVSSERSDGGVSGVNHSLVSLCWHIQVCEAERGQPHTDSQGWEMEGRCIRFSIMTHRCSITLQIKSKMLNFNQAALMAWCEEWLLCLQWKEAERRGDGQKAIAKSPGGTRGYDILIHQIAYWPLIREFI